VIYIVTPFVFFGRYNDVVAYPNNNASYHVSVRQYRILQSGFLQCIGRPKPPCHLLILPGVTPAYKGFTPSGKTTLVAFMLSKVYLYIWTFSTAYNKCALLLMQGTHSVYVAIAGEVVNRRSVLLRNFVLNGQDSASNSLLHIHAKRYNPFCQRIQKRIRRIKPDTFLAYRLPE
jgi:hypothetical protein